MFDDLETFDSISTINVEANGNTGGYNLKVTGRDCDGDEMEWEGHCLFLQGVSDLIKELHKRKTNL